MRILVLGCSGQLGQELQRSLRLVGEVIAFDRSHLDLTDGGSIFERLSEAAPAVVVNSAAYTDVDRAEAEPELARQVNAVAPGLLAQAAKELGAGLIHISTDFVFDGSQDDPYDELARPNPLGTYAQSKLDGEKAVEKVGGTYLILRTSWVYRLLGDHVCFPRKVLAWANQNPVLRIVDDQTGTPTWARDLATAIALLIRSGQGAGAWRPRATGVFHLASEGSASRFEWAKAVLEEWTRGASDDTARVVPAKSSEFPTPATRPGHVILNCGKFRSMFGFGLPDWRSSYGLASEELRSLGQP